jgi:Protein of unknown function (DUF3014)
VFNRAIPILAVLIVVGGAATWYWWAKIVPGVPVEQTGTPAPRATQPPPAVVAAAPAATLPALADSDAPFKGALLALPGAQGLDSLLRPENMIRHLVATVDNLPRHKLAVELRPLEPTGGSVLVSGGDLQANLDEHNGARYGPVMEILGNLDMHAVNDLYRHYYPLFQRAYEDLGYPQKSFNDRLLAVIDHLLDTPHPARPLALVRPKVFWEFADPALEARSAGQKLMLRLGSANQAVAERKLRELRALITTRSASPARTHQ